ncbi:MAG TPA: NAD(P)H-binding protein, partial [Spirochaetota bacterium]
MKLAIIGVSGFVGGFILSEAVTRGHHVTGIVRNPEKMKPQQNCTVVKGDVYNERELSLLLSGHDAVVSAFNPGWGNPSIRELFIKGSRSIINATKASGVRRLVFVGGAGSLEVNPGVQLVDSPEFPAEYKEGALGAREALSIIKKEHTLD